MKLVFSIIFILSTVFHTLAWAENAPEQSSIPISAPSALLMEKESGEIIYEKNASQRLAPASVTKVMTMLLIIEDIEAGKISEDDIVTASARAASFGGSCVFLEEGEQMTVRDMLKCIAVVSANDCAVAMAEELCGSEQVFVERMNRRAAELGMKDTNFKNCTGLFQDKEHYTSALDVAIMSRELIGHEKIKEYTGIWMDSIRGGEFGLSSTNKLLKRYPGCTGLKTGFTDSAMYCISATAERDGTEYIAVIMHADTADARNADAAALLNYAFANYSLCRPESELSLPLLPVDMGKQSRIKLELPGGSALLLPKSGGSPEYSLELPELVSAPLKKGDVLGQLIISSRGETLGRLDIAAGENVERIGFAGILALLGRGLLGL